MKAIPTLLCLTAGTLCLPAMSSAAPTRASFDVCVKAFVQTLPEKIGAAPRLRDARLIGSSASDAAPAQLEMVATNPKTRQVVWKATCVVNGRGELVAMRDER